MSISTTKITMELELDVAYTAYPAVRGHRDRYGAQEEPDEEAGVEIDSVKCNGVEVELTDDQIRDIEQQVMDGLEDDGQDYDPGKD